MSEFMVYNPNNKPELELPVIYGFNNGGSSGFLSAVAIAEDGVCLGGHCCSHEYFMPGDLGMYEGTRLDRHEKEYRPHYPEGYRMEFVTSDQIEGHEGLNKAFKANELIEEKTEKQ